ncbi:uncharacterized protein cubi_02084 [Cryptosporidium ubiquitum]|uniref:Uncharacterized protein n=1 Tax=Cryptosporidium ubiquitum TaxID=857276 RepID=A0A1J4MQ44_9CRYT|nr:uncharacterized protein cubi_02084 [Cryptosporidium ubiquitum]OII75563.1 hypothetical protein cubi_02084 [Cryptosporidium ubiquitum]
MSENEKKESSINKYQNNFPLISDSSTLSNEIEAIKSLIKVKGKLSKGKKLLLENQKHQQKKEQYENDNSIQDLKIKNQQISNDYTPNINIQDIAKSKIRNYFTCIMCIKLNFDDVFTKKNSEIKIGKLNYNELLIIFALNKLTQVYKNVYYKIGITSDQPKIYPTFDFPETKKIHDGQTLCNKEYNSIITNISSNSEFNLILNENYIVNKKIGLHLSLTRNHHISKKLSFSFLKNIIKKFNYCQVNYEIPEIVLKSQKIKIQTKLKSFYIFLDYDSIIILKNTSLYSENTTINGGIFVALQVHNASKITYLDPIIEMIDQVCVDLGIQPLYSERVFHISLFYIKKSDLYLSNTNYQNSYISSGNILETYSFKDYLASKLPLSSSTNSSSIKLCSSGSNNMIWINQIVFRIGIYEYYLILES